MALGGVDLNLLMVLQALLEEENLTRAGVRVGMPQPAMSMALARLRRHFKDELLIRSGNAYSLTPFARTLLPSVRESMQLMGLAFSPVGAQRPPVGDRKFTISLSDYSLVVLGEPLLRRVRELAPSLAIEIWPVTADVLETGRGLLQHDVLIAPVRARSAGQPDVICRDRFVCVVDPANPRLRDGRLSLEDLQALPHATAQLPHAEIDSVRHVLDGLSLTRNVVMMTAGWLPLPFLVAGTDMVAIIPERLARQVSSAAGVTVTEPPFGRIEMAEGAWWNPMRTTDPALSWLRTILNRTTVS